VCNKINEKDSKDNKTAAHDRLKSLTELKKELEYHIEQEELKISQKMPNKNDTINNNNNVPVNNLYKSKKSNNYNLKNHITEYSEEYDSKPSPIKDKNIISNNIDDFKLSPISDEKSNNNFSPNSKLNSYQPSNNYYHVSETEQNLKVDKTKQNSLKNFNSLLKRKSLKEPKTTPKRRSKTNLKKSENNIKEII